MIMYVIIFLVVTIVVTTSNLASITLSKSVERLLYEIKEDVASDENSEATDSNTVPDGESDIEVEAEQEQEVHEVKEDEKDQNSETEVHSNRNRNKGGYDAFSKAMAGSARKKPETSASSGQQDITKSNVGMSFQDEEDEEDDLQLLYEEDEEDSSSSDRPKFGIESKKYEEANKALETIKKRGESE